MRSLRLVGALTLALGAAGADAQVTVYQNDFQSAVQQLGATWSAVNRDQAGGGAATLGLQNLASSSSLGLSSRTFWDQVATLAVTPGFSYTGGNVSFRIYIWSSWDGFNCCGPDRVSFNINGGSELFNDYYEGQPGIVLADNAGGRRGIDYSFNFGNLGPNLAFNFVGDPTQDDEGWTIDNVQVQLTPALRSVAPEPSTYVLLASGLAAIAGVARRRRQG
jgi:hypothetical protein